jgi:hypothetical protein
MAASSGGPFQGRFLIDHVRIDFCVVMVSLGGLFNSGFYVARGAKQSKGSDKRDKLSLTVKIHSVVISSQHLESSTR